MRQAEKNQRGLTQQGRANRLTSLLMQLSEPQNAGVWIKGMHAPETLSGEEMERYLLMCRSGFTSMEDSFLQHRAGLLEENAFKSMTAGVRGQLGSRGMRAAWVLLSAQFGPDFVAYLNQQLTATETPVRGERTSSAGARRSRRRRRRKPAAAPVAPIGVSSPGGFFAPPSTPMWGNMAIQSVTLRLILRVQERGAPGR